MNDVRLRIVSYLVSMYLVESSALLFQFQPQRFARERYLRSRNQTAARSLDNLATTLPQVLDFVGLVNHYGYPGEEHVVTTVDGYRLRIHRIPGSPTRPKAEGKPVIFFQHGLLASSDTWVLLGPSKDFAYILADAGYDVWLGNARGNTYSRSHVKLSPDYDPEFWKFSFHEAAIFDMPAVVDHILKLTKQKSLVYIGHSMGTTISYALLSCRPEYNEKIDLVISLAPVAFWHAKPRPIIKFLMDNTDAIKNFLINARIYEVLPLTAANAQLAKTTCSDESVFQQLCLNFFYFTSGYNPGQLNTTLMPLFLSYFPAGSSTQTLTHFSQNINEGDFKMYDYGIVQNFATYRQSYPPSYNLTNIVTPVALFYGKGDVLVAPDNVYELSTKLPNVVVAEPIADNMFTHMDFLLARDIRSLVNTRVMQVMAKVLRRGSGLP